MIKENNMRFEKVSKEAFVKDCEKWMRKYNQASHGAMVKYYENVYEKITLPERSTSGSAGYDFKNPFSNSIFEGPVFIPTGIRVFLDKDKVLQIVPRSSSSKKGIMLANTIGIIDSDYVNAENEGDIIIALRSYYNTESNAIQIDHNEKIAQGIILPFYTVENDSADKSRTGGFGSTGK